MLTDVTISPIDERISNDPGEAGPDRRVEAARWAGDTFGSQTYMYAGPSDQRRGPNVEVQAYVLDGQQVARVTLCLHGTIGYADQPLSPAEARAVAFALLRSADEADALTTVRREAALVYGRQ